MMVEITDFDQCIWQRELDEFVPEHVFDAHTHIWSESHKKANIDDSSALRMPIALEDLHNYSRLLFPGRKLGYLLLATTLKDIDYEGHNRWIADQVKSAHTIDLPVVSSMLIVPGMSPSYVKDHIISHGVKVLKPYRVFANDPKECDIIDFLPEELLEVADELHLTVTLHLSKSLGPADEKNLKDLEYLTKRYTHVKWILVHCARAFNSVHLEQSIVRLAALDSVWMDTAAVCDPYTHYLLLKHFDREKILFGTDNISAGAVKGKYITFGYGWDGYWPKAHLEHCDPRCTFICYEQLRSQRQSAKIANLNAHEIENIFYRNSMKLFGNENYT